VKSHIAAKPITEYDYLNVDEYFESSIVKLVQLKLIIICIYKNPNSNIKILLDNLEITLDHFEKENNKIIIFKKYTRKETFGILIKNVWLESGDIGLL
jgi:hypothetical protein